MLRGPWCDRCGQSAEDFHRSAHKLIGDFLEGLFEADGRVFRTLPRLITRPGRLTRDYIDGKRAPQIPPFRLFVTMLVVLFLAGSLHATHVITLAGLPGRDRAEVLRELEQARTGIAGAGTPQTLAGFDDWMTVRLTDAVKDPRELLATMGEWARRFAFLTLPLSALLLALIFAGRGFFLFDHLIFSMHSLSFQGYLMAVVLLATSVTGGLAGVLLLLSPVHLFFHMRGVYRTGIAGTFVRMAVLAIGSAILFGLLSFALVLLGLRATS